MAKKQASSTSEKTLKTKVKKLEAEVERARTRAGRWKDEAKQTKRQLAEQTTRADTLEKKLAKARSAAASAKPRDASAPAAADPASASGEAPSDPDSTWTVARLRAEARTRGLTGLSNKNKAQLLAALR